MTAILVMTTGGTIGALAYPDPTNPPDYSTMPPDGEDKVLAALKLPTFQKFQVRGTALEARDSKLIDDDYRQLILTTILSASEQSALITHGTDRILETAEFLDSHKEALKGKAIILTGAMTPLANGPDSDGYKNLLFSLQNLANADKLTKSPLSIVLCGDDSGQWQPTLYPYKPGLYNKIYAEDGRYHRLQKMA